MYNFIYFLNSYSNKNAKKLFFIINNYHSDKNKYITIVQINNYLIIMNYTFYL